MKADGVTYRAWGENIAYIGGVSDSERIFIFIDDCDIIS